MGFLGGIGRGISRAATGGDHKMDLADYLKLAGMAAAAGTGNVPALVAMGASYAGEGTGIEELKTAGDIAGLATGVGGLASAAGAGASAASTAASAADAVGTAADTAGTLAEGVQAAEAAASPLIQGAPLADFAGAAAEGAQGAGDILQAGSQITPEMIQGANAAGNVFGTGADIAGQMDAVNNFVGPLPPELAQQDPGVFKQTLDSILGDTGQERWETVGDLSETIADVSAEMGQEGPLPPELPEVMITEDVMNYIPSHMALEDYMRQSGAPNPYAAMFSKYPYGG